MSKYFLISNLNFSCKRAEGMLIYAKTNLRFKSHYALLSIQTTEIYFCASQWSVLRSDCHKDYNNWTSLCKLAEVFNFFFKCPLMAGSKRTIFLLYTAFFSMLRVPKHIWHIWRLKIASSKHIFVIEDYSASPEFTGFSKNWDFA